MDKFRLRGKEVDLLHLLADLYQKCGTEGNLQRSAVIEQLAISEGDYSAIVGTLKQMSLVTTMGWDGVDNQMITPTPLVPQVIRQIESQQEEYARRDLFEVMKAAAYRNPVIASVLILVFSVGFIVTVVDRTLALLEKLGWITFPLF